MNSTKSLEKKFSVNRIARVLFAFISVLFLQFVGLPVSPVLADSCGYSNIVTGGHYLQLKELGDDPKYVGKADSNSDRYYYPKSTNDASQAGRLVVKNITGNLQNGGTIHLQTLDKDVWKESWLSYDLLGAFGNNNALYYWNDYGDKSDWKVARPSNSENTGPIQYGEPVLISNGYYNNQYLKPDGKGYLTTTYDAHQWQFIDYDLRRLDFQRIEYDTKKRKISDPTPVVVGRGTATNTNPSGSTPSKLTVKLTIDQIKTSNFSRTEGVELTIGRTFTAGIPEVASVSGSIQVSTNRSNTYGEEESFTNSFGADYEVTVAPGKTEVVEAVATQAQLSVPYVMYYRTPTGNTVQSCGTWSGTTYYDLNFTQHTATGPTPPKLGEPI
ncbi:hypothetical protein [Coleofasciculus sp.]|uniref:hypothetical protein n=1 Tax=Coleofasciculus sp. TaxID=3100458 RepID=UPI0039F841F7